MVPPFPFPVVWRQKLVQLIKPGIWRLSGTRGAGDCGAIISVSGQAWCQKGEADLLERDNLCTDQGVERGCLLFCCTNSPLLSPPLNWGVVETSDRWSGLSRSVI